MSFLIYALLGIGVSALFYWLGYAAGRRNGHYEAGCGFGSELSAGEHNGDRTQYTNYRQAPHLSLVPSNETGQTESDPAISSGALAIRP